MKVTFFSPPSFPLHHTNQSKVLRAQTDARVLDQINPASRLAAPLPDARCDCRGAASHEGRAVCKFSAYDLMTEQVLQVKPSGWRGGGGGASGES